MIILELQQVEVDHCLACGGIWLDSGELEMLFDDAKQVGQIVGSFQRAADMQEKVRRCPICLKKMQKVFAGGDESVVIDQCPKSHGLWFDRGELPQVIAKGSLDKEQKIIKLLSRIFGKESEAKNVS